MTDVHHYIAVTAHRLRALNNQIGELSLRDYPSSTPITLAEVIQRILSRAFAELENLNHKLDKTPINDAYLHVREINKATLWLGQLSEAIQGAQISSPMSSLIEAYEDICGRIAFGTQMIIYPQWTYNATYLEVTKSLEQWVKQIGPTGDMTLFRGVPHYLVIITFPAIEERNILRHAILAHEIGHFADMVHGLLEDMMKEQILDQNLMGQILTIGRRLPGKNTPAAIAVNVVTSWVKELIADLFGTCIMGPAYIFAFDDIARVLPLPQIEVAAVSHPPFSLRIKFMIDLARKLYFEPLQRDSKSNNLNRDQNKTLTLAIQRIIRLADIPERPGILGADGVDAELGSLIYQLGRRALEIAFPLVQRSLELIAAEGWFCTTDDILDAIGLQELIQHGFSPSEAPWNSEHNPTLAAIMNSGWIQLIQHETTYSYFGDSVNIAPNVSDVQEKYFGLQDLVAKAIESSLFRAEYLKRKG